MSNGKYGVSSDQFGVTSASFWEHRGDFGIFWGAKGAQMTNSRFRASAGRPQGECKESARRVQGSARRVQGGCEYRSKGNLRGARVP